MKNKRLELGDGQEDRLEQGLLLVVCRFESEKIEESFVDVEHDKALQPELGDSPVALSKRKCRMAPRRLEARWRSRTSPELRSNVVPVTKSVSCALSGWVSGSAAASHALSFLASAPVAGKGQNGWRLTMIGPTDIQPPGTTPSAADSALTMDSGCSSEARSNLPRGPWRLSTWECGNAESPTNPARKTSALKYFSAAAPTANLNNKGVGHCTGAALLD